MIAFIKIRAKQFYRAMLGMGLFRMTFLLGLVIFIGFTIFKGSETQANAYLLTAIFLGVIGWIHLKREDKLFLKSHFKKHRSICFTEYTLLSLPIAFCLLIHAQWVVVGILLAGIGLVVQLDFKPMQWTLNSKIQRWIPADSFEWKAGIRKTLFLIVPLWILALGTSFFIGSVPVAILILGFIPLSFHEKGVPLQMLLAYELGAKKFLLHKIKMQLIPFSVLTLPLVFSFLIFHWEYWYIPIAEYFLFVSMQVYLVVTKYAFYEPNSKSAAAQTYVSIGSIGIVLPFFLPLIWVLTVWFYFVSADKLNFYLNDYN